MLYDYGERMFEIMKEKNVEEEELRKKAKIPISIMHGFLWYNLSIDFIQFERMLKVLDVSVVEFFSVDKGK